MRQAFFCQSSQARSKIRLTAMIHKCLGRMDVQHCLCHNPCSISCVICWQADCGCLSDTIYICLASKCVGSCTKLCPSVRRHLWTLVRPPPAHLHLHLVCPKWCPVSPGVSGQCPASVRGHVSEVSEGICPNVRKCPGRAQMWSSHVIPNLHVMTSPRRLVFLATRILAHVGGGPIGGDPREAIITICRAHVRLDAEGLGLAWALS